MVQTTEATGAITIPLLLLHELEGPFFHCMMATLVFWISSGIQLLLSYVKPSAIPFSED